MVSGFGCWAACLCSGPAYTLSLRYIARPRGPRGSMPFTASSMARKLKVYAGPEHKHAAQQPKPLTI